MNTDQLLERYQTGDQSAVNELLDAYRAQLRRMVSVRLDQRIQGRVDPSDVVQETIFEAARRLPEFVETKPIPFYAWLRQIASNKLIDLHRHHITYQKRAVHREQPANWMISDGSVVQLANRLIANQTSVEGQAMRKELRQQVRSVLNKLCESHREILVLLFLEQLSTADAADVLGISRDAVRSRQLRALEHFGRLIGPTLESS